MFTKTFTNKTKFLKEKNAINFMISMQIPFISYHYHFSYLSYSMPYFKYTLEDVITKLSKERRIKILKECDLYIKEMHKNGYGHGDFKAKNIVLNDTGSICVIDFETTNNTKKSIENDIQKFKFLKIQLEEGIHYLDSIRLLKFRLK